MKRYNRQPSAACQSADRIRYEPLQRHQLVVHRYAHGLKCSRRWMYPPAAGNLQRSHNDVCELLRCCNRFSLAGAHNRASDLARSALFSILKDQIRQVMLGQLIDQLGGAFTSALIHSHVQRSIRDETETSLALLELKGRYAKVSQHAPNFDNAGSSERPADLFEVCV